MSSMDFGSIPLPSSKYDKFNDNVVFRGRGWNWIDPLKEINASVVGLQNGKSAYVALASSVNIENTIFTTTTTKEMVDTSFTDEIQGISSKPLDRDWET